MIHVAGIIRRHLENVLTYLTHRISNAVTEGLNAKIHMDQVLLPKVSRPRALQARDPLSLRQARS